MRAFLFSIASFVFLSVLNSCAQRLDEFEVRMRDMDERMKIVESKGGGPVGSDHELLEGRKLADVRSTLATMRNELTVVSSKVDSMELEFRTLRDQVDNQIREIDRRLGQQSTSSATAAATPMDPKEAKYREALNLHQAGNFAQARKLFEEFLKENPKSSLADNSVYWMGESYMAEREYKKALIRFDDLIVKFPNSDKKCDARDRQIEALRALGMEDQAKTFADLRSAECKK